MLACLFLLTLCLLQAGKLLPGRINKREWEKTTNVIVRVEPFASKKEAGWNTKDRYPPLDIG